MKAPLFLYRRPDSLAEAAALLADNAGEAQVLAGGQSLMPTLNMRLSAPGMLVDINRIESLRGIRTTEDSIHLGALVRHRDVLASEVVAAQVPLLALAIPHVAHMAVRNRGTTCGSLALADPSAEMPAVAVLLNARIHLGSKEGAREIAARDFFQDLYVTARRDDELITGVSFPRADDSEVFRFAELSRRHGDFAVVGIGVKARCAAGAISGLDVVIFGSEPTPLVSDVTGDMTVEKTTSDARLREMSFAIADGMNPIGNHQGRPETKRRQAAVMLERAFADLRQELSDV